jgi:hypothetical protein
VRRSLLLSFALVSALVSTISGCGEGAQPDIVAANAGTVTTTVTAAAIATCPAGPFVTKVRLADEMDDALDVLDEHAHDFTDAVAVRLAGGAYTMYLADYDLDPAAFGSFFYEPPTPPSGHWLVTVFVTAYNATDLPPALVAGSEVTVTDEPGAQTLGLLAQGPMGMYNSASDAVGSLTVLHVDDARICVEVDYTDYTTAGVVQKHLAGAFTADVVPLG